MSHPKVNFNPKKKKKTVLNEEYPLHRKLYSKSSIY